MMLRLGLGLVLLSTAATAAVETALLPDPDAPARLVLAVAPSEGWVVAQTGRSVVVTFPRTQMSIDTSAVPLGADPWRGRLETLSASADAEGTRLEIGLACPCAVAVSSDGEARVALDVIGADLPSGPVLRARAIAPLRAPSPTPRETRTANTQPPAERANTSELTAARDRLRSQLEKAAAAGLITLKDPPDPGSKPLNSRDARAQINPWDHPAPGPRARSPRDIPPIAPPPSAPGRATLRAGSTTQPACLPDSAFALPIVETAAFSRDLAQLRGQLVGEFDRPDPASIDRLARFYIAHGLGAEALFLLAAFPDESRQGGVEAMARALAQKPQPPGGPLEAQGCPGAHRLWRRLAKGPGQMAEAGWSPGTLDAALSPLGEPLRSLLAIRIGLDAATAGQWGDARMAQRIASRADRAGVAPSPARRLLDSRILIRDGLLDVALPELTALWAGGGPEGAQAMLALAQLGLDGRLPASTDTRLLRIDLGALAFSAAGTTLGTDALVAEAALAGAALGSRAALDILDAGEGLGIIDGSRKAEAMAMIVQASEHGSVDTALGLAYAKDPARFRAALAEPSFRTALARSLAGLGLPAQGADILSAGDLSDPSLATALAEGYLAAGQAQDALDLGDRLPEGPERAAILAGAFAALGRPAEALDQLLAAQAGTPEQRARLAWAAQDWDATAAALDELAAQDPDLAISARLALARRRSGDVEADGPTDTPAEGVGSDALDPSRLADPADPTAISAWLTRLRAETVTLEQVLSDG
ncbi:MAG: hypothetical protein ACFBRM_06860 [Pikeienuella sp.]